MMYCKDCKDFFAEPVQVKVRELHDEVDTRQYEDYIEEHCPKCGSDYIEEADKCVMCGEPLPQGESLCERCIEDIQVVITLLADRKGIAESEAKDGLCEYLNMEDR